MFNGKNIDDGYRGIHICYQKNNHHYPIEILFNTYYDRQFNDWLHDKFYKRNIDPLIGKRLQKEYENSKRIQKSGFIAFITRLGKELADFSDKFESEVNPEKN